MTEKINLTNLKTSLIYNIEKKHSKLQKVTLGLILSENLNLDLSAKTYLSSIIKYCIDFNIPLESHQLKIEPDHTNINEIINYISDIHKKDINYVGILPIFSNDINDYFIKDIHSKLEKINCDVEGIAEINTYNLYNGNKKTLIPCTVKSIMDIIDYVDPDISGKNVTIIGRSNRVGKALLHTLLNENATVTVCHSYTDIESMKYYIKNSDYVITAINKPEYFDESFIDCFNNQTFIDVGICTNSEGKICGNLSKKLYDNNKLDIRVTTVPNGVGSLTTLELFDNLFNLISMK